MNVELKVLEEKERISRSTWLGEITNYKGWDVVVDLPNLGVQLVFILIELCFHCQGIFGLEIYSNIIVVNVN